MTVGVVLRPVASHRARYVSDKMAALPLAAGEGWVFPAGAEGYCSWAGEHEFLNLAIGAAHFDGLAASAHEVGRIGAGALDPLTVTLALQIHTAEDGLYRDTMASALAAHLAQTYAGTKQALASSLDDARLKRVEDFIDQHLADALSLDALANVAAMSAFHFARSFKKRTGLAPHQFIVARRIERAKVLLRTTGLPVSEIAVRVGWKNPSKFGAQFKKLAGVTPGAWRAG